MVFLCEITLDFTYYFPILGIVTFQKEPIWHRNVIPRIASGKTLAFYMEICYDSLRLTKKGTSCILSTEHRLCILCSEQKTNIRLTLGFI